MQRNRIHFCLGNCFPSMSSSLQDTGSVIWCPSSIWASLPPSSYLIWQWWNFNGRWLYPRDFQERADGERYSGSHTQSLLPKTWPCLYIAGGDWELQVGNSWRFSGWNRVSQIIAGNGPRPLLDFAPCGSLYSLWLKPDPQTQKSFLKRSLQKRHLSTDMQNMKGEGGLPALRLDAEENWIQAKMVLPLEAVSKNFLVFSSPRIFTLIIAQFSPCKFPCLSWFFLDKNLSAPHDR